MPIQPPPNVACEYEVFASYFPKLHRSLGDRWMCRAVSPLLKEVRTVSRLCVDVVPWPGTTREVVLLHRDSLVGGTERNICRIPPYHSLYGADWACQCSVEMIGCIYILSFLLGH